MCEKHYDVDNIRYYLNELEDTLVGTPLLERLSRSLDKDNNSRLNLDGLSEKDVQMLGERLEKYCHIVHEKREKEFDEKMRNQRAERGYSDRDVWNFFNWFIEIARPMLLQLAEKHVGYIPLDENLHSLCDTLSTVTSQILIGTSESGKEADVYSERWEKMLRHMAFLLSEMDEETCSHKNPLQEEWWKACKEFEEKYGFGGEGLKSEEEKAEEKKRTHIVSICRMMNLAVMMSKNFSPDGVKRK